MPTEPTGIEHGVKDRRSTPSAGGCYRDLELQVGRLPVLDVVGLPIERRWSIVNLGARPLTAAAGVCRDFLEAHTATNS